MSRRLEAFDRTIAPNPRQALGHHLARLGINWLFIEHALSGQSDARFQSGKEMRKALRAPFTAVHGVAA
ncbi:MAG: hypothetical protein ABW205_10865 [Burkholderiales bacterium]|jgi:hypothetical protein